MLSSRDVKFHLGIFYFPIVHHSSIFSTHVSEVSYLKKQMSDCLLHDLLIAKLAAYGFDYDSGFYAKLPL